MYGGVEAEASGSRTTQRSLEQTQARCGTVLELSDLLSLPHLHLNQKRRPIPQPRASRARSGWWIATMSQRVWIYVAR